MELGSTECEVGMTVMQNEKTTIQETPIPAELRRRWLRDMALIREFELRTMQSYQEALIGGFCHVYNGQEAVAVGCTAATQPDDPIITAYRDHGHALARGMEPKYAMAEMFGRIGGSSKGMGGSMHLFDVRHHFYGGHGIVGGHIPVGVGLAFAAKYEWEVLKTGGKRVSLSFLGDGALNQGAVHEAMNLAAIYQLPAIVIVENNRYAMGTAIERATANADDLPSRAAAFGIPAWELDGMDVVSIYRTMKAIVDRCRENQEPAFVVMHTYRYKGHSMSDPQKYRSKDEIGEYEERDPIRRLAEQLRAEGALDDDEFKAMQKSIRTEVREAVRWAQESPEPSLEDELYSDVYAEPYGPYKTSDLPEMLRHDGDTKKG
ncbi:MAG: pyruvate dehydrogenase (acetyl-transferring) E1 component subunit alpha [Phycisphaerales bacterium JB038]